MNKPSFGSPVVSISLQDLAALLPPTEVPQWVIAGASIAIFTDEVRVAPALVLGHDAIMISIAPTARTIPDLEYTVIVAVERNVVGTQTITFRGGQVGRGDTKELIFADVRLKPGVQIVANVIRGIRQEDRE